MPHSSGGGSHSGGGHSSSGSHSGGRSYSGGGRSYGYKRNTRISRNYFLGSARYVYYKNNRPNYFYANCYIDNIRQPSIFSKIFTTLTILPFIILGIIMLKLSIKIPKKLYQDKPYEIIIQDNANVLGDTANLKETLQNFYKKTGIAPAIITVNNENWERYYNSLENYAYDLYVNNFADEEHWLIVYSEPVTPNIIFNDWYWEGMQGNDTDSILTGKKTYMFNQNMQKYLTSSSKYSVCLAIQKNFENILPTVMEKEVDIEMLLMAIIFTTIGFIFLIPFWLENNYDHIKYKDIKNAVPYDNNKAEVQCEACRGIYIEGTCTSCPYCGAPIGNSKNVVVNMNDYNKDNDKDDDPITMK